MEGGEPGGMGGLSSFRGGTGMGAITAVPLAQIAGTSGRASPTIQPGAPGLGPLAFSGGGGMGAGGYPSVVVAPPAAAPIGITPYAAPAQWGKVVLALLGAGVVIYGAYRVASWWDRRR